MKFFDWLFGRNKDKNSTKDINFANTAANETNSYEPFVFCGVAFADAFELIDVCNKKTPKDGKYFGVHRSSIPCFDEFDRAEVGRSCTYYFFSASSEEEVEKIKGDYFKATKCRPMIRIEQDKEGYLSEEMTITK